MTTVETGGVEEVSDHKVLNVYGAAKVATVLNAIETVRSDVDEELTTGEALTELSVAYTGWDAREGAE